MDEEWKQLLREQEQFLAGNSKPAAKVVGSSPKVVEKQVPVFGKIVERTVSANELQPIRVNTHGFPQPVKQKLVKSIIIQKKDTSSGRGDSIEQENIEKIRNMSLEEIQEAQNDLKRMLSPELVAKFTKKTTVPVKKDSKPIPLEEIQSEDQLFEQLQKIDAEETKWITETARNDTTSSVRVDFNGLPLDNTQPIAVHTGLYHHGNDPEAPGYTIDELMLLLRSTVPSQRASALRIVTNALRKARDQYVEDSSISYPLVIPDTMTMVLRDALDDSYSSSIPNAIDALHAYLVPSSEFEAMDERFEEFLGHEALPSVNSIHSSAKSDSLPFQLVSDGKNPVSVLIQAHLLDRIEYLLRTISNEAMQLQLVEILRAIAFHSAESAEIILEHEKLMKTVRDILTDHTTCSLAVMKLVRTLCQSNRSVAQDLLTKSETIQCALGFLALKDCDMALHIEALRIWRVCLAYNLGLSSFTYLYPLLCGFQISTGALTSQPAEKLAAIYAALETLLTVCKNHPVYLQQMKDLAQKAVSDSLHWIETSQHSVALGAALHFIATYPDPLCMNTEELKSAVATVCVETTDPNVLFGALRINSACTIPTSSIDIQEELQGPPSRYFKNRMVRHLKFHQLRLEQDREKQMMMAMRLMGQLLAGDEEIARWIVSCVISDESVRNVYLQLFPIPIRTNLSILQPKQQIHLPVESEWIYYPFSRMDSEQLNVVLLTILQVIPTQKLLKQAIVSPERVLYHLLHAFFIPNIDQDLMTALSPTLQACVAIIESGALAKVFGSDLMEFVESFVTQFAAISYGNTTFAQCVTLFLQMEEIPAAIRHRIWSTPGICHLLEAFPSIFDKCICKLESDPKIIETFHSIVQMKRLNASDFAYQVARFHLDELNKQQHWFLRNRSIR